MNRMHVTGSSLAKFGLVALTMFAGGCGDDDNNGGAGDQELINEVTMTLAPVGGGAAQTAVILDPDGNGPLPPAAQTGTLNLTPGTTYTGAVTLRNTTVNPPIDITVEVIAENVDHRFFYTVTPQPGVEVMNLDLDDNNVVFGQTFDVVAAAAAAAGNYTIKVILSHFDDLPKGDGLTPSPETDVDVTFVATVVP